MVFSPKQIFDDLIDRSNPARSNYPSTLIGREAAFIAARSSASGIVEDTGAVRHMMRLKAVWYVVARNPDDQRCFESLLFFTSAFIVGGLMT
jgi:hypothetical protein